MTDVKVIERLADAFDAVLLLIGAAGGAPSEAAQCLIAKFPGKAYLAGPDAVGAGLGAVVLSCPIDDGPQQAQALTSALAAAGPRRPLVWVEQGGYGAFLSECDAFKVLHLRTRRLGLKQRVLGLIGKNDPPESEPDVSLFDLVVAPNADLIPTNMTLAGATLIWGSTESFVLVEDAICAQATRLYQADKRLNVLILYDDKFSHIKPVLEHLKAFEQHSRHQIQFLSVAPGPQLEFYAQAWPDSWNFGHFDVVVWHYSIRAAFADHMPAVVMEQLGRFGGLKLMFIQDEYDHVEMTWSSIRRAGIDVVMTCAPTMESARLLYPEDKVPGVELLQNLTGYVPDDEIERFARPMEARELRLSYRGRVLPYQYGDLGREKYLIGKEMSDLANARGVAVDIEVDDSRRIYGDDWYRFQAAARATLVSESGANVVNFDGGLTQLCSDAMAAGVSYQDFHAAHLAPLEGQVVMNQVSPKVFEAIRLRTALVGFEGRYSGVIQPDVHFIPLKKDFSNVAEVFAKLEDVDFLKTMTERAYRDVIDGGQWSYGAFVRRFDDIVQSRVLRSAKAEIVSVPMAYRRRGEDHFHAIAHMTPMEFALNSGVLRQPFRWMQLERAILDVRAEEFEPKHAELDKPPPDARVVFTAGPDALNCYEYWRNAGAHVQVVSDGVRLTTPPVAGHYAAQVDVKFPGIWFDHELCWIRVSLKNVVGKVGLSVFNPDKNEIYYERFLAGQGDDHEFLVPVPAPSGPWLMLRTAVDEPAQLTFAGLQVLAAFRYRSAVMDLVDVLSEHPVMVKRRARAQAPTA